MLMAGIFDIRDWMSGFFRASLEIFILERPSHVTVTYDRYSGAAPLHRHQTGFLGRRPLGRLSFGAHFLERLFGGPSP